MFYQKKKKSQNGIYHFRNYGITDELDSIGWKQRRYFEVRVGKGKRTQERSGSVILKKA